MRLKELNTDHNEPRASLGDAPYAVGWSGQSHEWYGELESPGEEGKGRYKPKGDGGRIVAINVPDYATAQKIEKKLDDSYNAGKFIDGNSVHGGIGDGYYVDYHSAWIRPMHEMDDEMWRLEYDKPKDFGSGEDNIDDAIKLAISMGGDMTGATRLIRKKYGDEVLQNPKVQDALQHANENIQTEKQKAGPAGQLKGKDVIKKQKAGTTKNPTRDLLVGEINNESKISWAYFKELENKLTEIKEELKIREGDNIYHDCAKSFTHKVYGECSVIPGEHTLLENGTVTHYDATFTSCGNTYKVGNVAVENMHNVISEYHAHKKKKTKKKVKEADVDPEKAITLGDVDIDATVAGLPAEPEKSPFSKDISDREKTSRDIHAKSELLTKYAASQKIKDVKHLTNQFDDIEWYKMIQYVNREKFSQVKYQKADRISNDTLSAFKRVGPQTRNLTVTSYALDAQRYAGFKSMSSVSPRDMSWDKLYEYYLGVLSKANRYFSNPDNKFTKPGHEDQAVDHFKPQPGDPDQKESQGTRFKVGNWVTNSETIKSWQEVKDYIFKLNEVLKSKQEKDESIYMLFDYLLLFTKDPKGKDSNLPSYQMYRLSLERMKEAEESGTWKKSTIDQEYSSLLGALLNSTQYKIWIRNHHS